MTPLVPALGLLKKGRRKLKYVSIPYEAALFVLDRLICLSSIAYTD